MMYIEISQGKRGRWRWVAYSDLGINGKRVCDGLSNAYGFDTPEQAERAARKVCRDDYEIRIV